MPNTAFDNNNYPRIYKPDVLSGVVASSLLLILIGSSADAFMHHAEHPFVRPWYISLLVLFILFFGLYLGLNGFLFNVGYSVTLEPEVVRIKNFFGEKLVLRSDIESYRYISGGKGFSKLRFNLKSDRKQSPSDIVNDNTDAAVFLVLTFNLDQKFYDWVTSLRLEAGFSGIPKVFD